MPEKTIIKIRLSNNNVRSLHLGEWFPTSDDLLIHPELESTYLIVLPSRQGELRTNLDTFFRGKNVNSGRPIRFILDPDTEVTVVDENNNFLFTARALN